jgi:hypothetical protein
MRLGESEKRRGWRTRIVNRAITWLESRKYWARYSSLIFQIPWATQDYKNRDN